MTSNGLVYCFFKDQHKHFKQCEYYETKLPDLYDLLTDNTVKPNDFIQLNASQNLSQTMHVWFKGGFPEPLIESENNMDFLPSLDGKLHNELCWKRHKSALPTPSYP